VALEAGRLTLGADPANDLALAGDPALSRLHAVLDRYGAGWCVRDLDSRNGTFVNGRRVLGERPLRPGDELRVGATRLVYRGDEPASIREIADALVVTEAAVKQHLAHLYDKFGIQGGGERRRVRLANEALRRGAVTMAGLRQEVAWDNKRVR
jgi:pSer/pThr/pTyr-binding forkhead associated (FHA) protein